MNSRNFFSLPACIILSCFLTGCNQTHSGKKILDIGNELFSKNFMYTDGKPGAIVVEVINKQGQITSLTRPAAPFFEFVLDHKLTRSNDKMWKFKSHDVREMGNGGKEHKLVFSGERKHVKGLEVVIFQQVFPGSILVREKLELHATGGQSFSLNKLDEKLHFKFPQYTLAINDEITPSATEIRLASWELKPVTFTGNETNPRGNHMYYPDLIPFPVRNQEPQTVKGPIQITSTENFSWITAYEHASQDNTKGLVRQVKDQTDGRVTDALQGVQGVFDFRIVDEDFMFLGIHTRKNTEGINVSVDMMRGGYLDGEVIKENLPYSTVWTATAFYEGDDIEEGKALIRNYLFHQICEKPASRKASFYYNTWGMQREVSRQNRDLLRGIMTYDHIFREIDYAAQLGVDLFVLDDGWEQAQGVWRPHKERLPEGLAPIKEYLDKYGIKMGVWFSPMGIDSAAQRYKDHPEWVIKDSQGNPVLGQWNHPVFDFVSDFFGVFIDDCKKLVDEGAVFFKWDAINTFNSTLPDMHHGSANYSKEEIRARYEYLLPIYVTRAMEILTDYKPELVIEVDLTESRRVMMGLAPLSQGKLFFMNNGASGYNDYTSFRTKSMRTIPNEYAHLIPPELFTYANYPQNLQGSMDYNVNTSLLAGHGFWGNLGLTKERERLHIGKKVHKSKQVLPLIAGIKMEVSGKVGDSPEIYSQVNSELSAGQIFVFSADPVSFTEKVKINSRNLLAVLNHPYQVNSDTVILNFDLREVDSSREAFIIPNQNQGISITASTSSLDNVESKQGWVKYVSINPGEQTIKWGKKNGKPVVVDSGKMSFKLTESADFYFLQVKVSGNGQEVILKSL